MSGDKISIIAAMARGRVIGLNNDLPWKPIPWDFKNFQKLTMGCPIIMGSKTSDSILAKLGKHLPGRYTIVASRTRAPAQTDEYAVAPSIEQALNIAHGRTDGKGEIFIAGGGEIYQQTLSFVDRLYITFIDMRSFGGDTFFPGIDRRVWVQKHSQRVDQGEQSPYNLNFVHFERRHLL